MIAPTKLAGQEPLEVDDIIDVYINGARHPYEYKITKVSLNPNVTGRVNYYNLRRANSSCEWETSTIVLDNASDKYYTWIKKENVAVQANPTYPDGCVCRRCNSRNRWAIPNQKDDTYICYECR